MLFTRESDPLEVVLRKNRAEPRGELVADLAARVSAMPAHRQSGSRFAFAAALAVLVVGTFLSFGGAAYAASGQTAGAQNPATPVSTSAAADEYGEDAVAQVQTPPTTPTTPTTPKTSEVAGATASSPPAKSGSLPFTGVGLGTTALVSLLLVSLGVYLRRRESRQ
jgi:hypothetical protein